MVGDNRTTFLLVEKLFHLFRINTNPKPEILPENLKAGVHALGSCLVFCILSFFKLIFIDSWLFTLVMNTFSWWTWMSGSPSCLKGRPGSFYKVHHYSYSMSSCESHPCSNTVIKFWPRVFFGLWAQQLCISTTTLAQSSVYIYLWWEVNTPSALNGQDHSPRHHQCRVRCPKLLQLRCTRMQSSASVGKNVSSGALNQTPTEHILWDNNVLIKPQNFITDKHQYRAITGLWTCEPFFWWQIPLCVFVPLRTKKRTPLIIPMTKSTGGQDLHSVCTWDPTKQRWTPKQSTMRRKHRAQPKHKAFWLPFIMVTNDQRGVKSFGSCVGGSVLPVRTG